MKNLRTSVLCVCISFIGLSAFAQTSAEVPPVREPDYNKPKLFSALPDLITITPDFINAAFTSRVGETVDIAIGENNSFRFSGEVISIVSKYQDAVKTVIIRSSNYNGARFFISRVTSQTGAITYTGRLLSKEHGDVYEIKYSNDGMALVKTNYPNAVTE
jgi:hypothetical protein